MANNDENEANEEAPPTEEIQDEPEAEVEPAAVKAKASKPTEAKASKPAEAKASKVVEEKASKASQVEEESDSDDRDDADEDEADHDDAEPEDLDSDAEAAALHQFEHDDPLAPGYDLDGGELIDQQETHLPWQTDVSTPKEFFTTELLYRFDVVEPASRKLFDGTYRIELDGEEKANWSVTVAEDLTVSNSTEDAEIVFKLSGPDFMELVNGRLNPQLAILAQKMKVDGEVRKAILFQELLIPAPE